MLFALHDSIPGRITKITEAQATRYNEQGYGIFHVVNKFTGEDRVVANLEKFFYAYVDMDSGSKREQLDRLENGPLYPSVIVESANGYHAYWRIVDLYSMEHWDDIVKYRLIPYYESDKKCCDPLRLLRRPGYFHMKDKEEPFLVMEVIRTDYIYSIDEFFTEYPLHKPEVKTINVATNDKYHFDPFKAFERLNGTEWFHHKAYELLPQSNGNYNIKEVGKNGTTGCFIDRNGYFGGLWNGNTLYKWLEYYGHRPYDIVNLIKELRDGTRERPQA